MARPGCTAYAGVDVAAKSSAGGQQLDALRRRAGAPAAGTLVALEATGACRQGAAPALTAAGWAVSVASPASARHYAQARLRRAATAAVDAAVLAAYGRDRRPAPCTPPPADVPALQPLIRQRDDPVACRTPATSRRHAPAQLPDVPAEVRQPRAALLHVLRERIAALDAAIRRRAAAAASIVTEPACLTSSKGVGALPAAIVLTAARPLHRRLTPQRAVACAGLDPAPRRSGGPVRGAPRIGRTGNARLRRALYRAALSAARSTPLLRPFYQRLLARGKGRKVALVAVARKLLAPMITLPRPHRTFDPRGAANHPPRGR